MRSIRGAIRGALRGGGMQRERDEAHVQPVHALHVVARERCWTKHTAWSGSELGCG